MLTLFYLYFILTQLTTLFFRDDSFPGVCNIFFLVLFLTVITVPDTCLGHNEHLLNAESKYQFPLSDQYSIVFSLKIFIFLNNFYMFIYCTFHHLLVIFLMFTFSFKSTAPTALNILMAPVIQVFHISKMSFLLIRSFTFFRHLYLKCLNLPVSPELLAPLKKNSLSIRNFKL